MKNKKELVFIILGAVLILGALLLYLYNGYEDNEAGQQAEVVASEIISVIENKEVIQIKPEEPMEEERTELEVVMIDGYEYIGYLKIDALGLNLPILSNWSNNGLKIAPCRHFGSSITDDLVIAAHNYKSHFGYIYKLKSGDRVTFTEMDGFENIYEFSGMITVKGTDVEAVQNSGHDLALYTCTSGGQSRIVVFFDRVTDEEVT